MFSLDELVEVFLHIITMKDAKIDELSNRIESMQHSLNYYQDKWVRECISHERKQMFTDDMEPVQTGIDEVDR